MSTYIEQLEIQEIYFESTDNQVLVKGTLYKEHLNYPTQLVVNQSDLNKIVNALQAINPDVSIFDAFEVDRLYNGSNAYTLSAEKNDSLAFQINNLIFNDLIQIRA